MNVERLKMEGDILAVQIWRTMRLIVSDSIFKLYYVKMMPFLAFHIMLLTE